MITLLGATGYTGRLVARVLERRGLPFCIAGRSPAKLAALSASLTSQPRTLVADARQPETLAPLFEGTRLLVDCAGPYTDLGEPVVAGAAARGVHYLDVSNELAYVYRMRQYDRLAAQTGAAIVPACGIEVAISDCAVADMASTEASFFDEIHVVYLMGGSVLSVGTRLSALRTFATSWFAYRGGRLVGQAPGAAVRRGEMGGRPYSALAVPSAEAVTLPAHCRVRDIGVWLAVAPRSAALLASLAPLVSWLLRTPLGWLTARVARRFPPREGDGMRARGRFVVQVETSQGGRRRTRVWSGRDPYGLTAEIVGHAAEHMTVEAFTATGVLAPAQALEPTAFLQWLARQDGVSVEEG